MLGVEILIFLLLMVKLPLLDYYCKISINSVIICSIAESYYSHYYYITILLL